MTIDEAILHSEDRAKADCSECADEHRKLACWLKELKEKRENFQEDLNFMLRIQNLLISKDGWVIGTGNYQSVNEEMLYRLEQNIKRHPILWKWFFMVA